MFTLAVLNQKGGVGKSTLAVHLASAAHLARRRTLLVDMDGQGTSFDWFAARGASSKLEGLAVVRADRALAPVRFRELTAGYDVVVLDGPPRLGDVTRSAAVAADVVLVPVQPSGFDFWATSETAAVLDDADVVRAELGKRPVRRVFAVNRAVTGTVAARETPARLAESGELAGVVCQRIAFSEATAGGEVVLTTEPNGAAADEIRSLYRAIFRSKKERT